METFRTLHEQLTTRHRNAVRAYVISHTTGPADLLEVLLLMKEAGLAKAGGEAAMLRIVPLFEARETLDDAAVTMRAVLDQPVYRAALAAMDDLQEVMVGYSDSTRTRATSRPAGRPTRRSSSCRRCFARPGCGGRSSTAAAARSAAAAGARTSRSSRSRRARSAAA